MSRLAKASILTVAAIVGLYAGHRIELDRATGQLMDYTYGRFKPANRWSHTPVEAGTTKSWVPMGNPDIVASRAVYDVGHGPIRFRGVAPANGYWSLTLYDGTSRNFLAQNNDRFRGRPYEILLFGPGTASVEARTRAGGRPYAISSTPRGYAVIRSFVDPATDLAALDALRQDWRIEPLS